MQQIASLLMKALAQSSGTPGIMELLKKISPQSQNPGTPPFVPGQEQGPAPMGTQPPVQAMGGPGGGPPGSGPPGIMELLKKISPQSQNPGTPPFVPGQEQGMAPMGTQPPVQAMGGPGGGPPGSGPPGIGELLKRISPQSQNPGTPPFVPGQEQEMDLEPPHGSPRHAFPRSIRTAKPGGGPPPGPQMIDKLPGEDSQLNRILSSIASVKQGGVVGGVQNYINYPEIQKMLRGQMNRQIGKEHLGNQKTISEIQENRATTGSIRGEEGRDQEGYEYEASRRGDQENRDAAELREILNKETREMDLHPGKINSQLADILIKMKQGGHYEALTDESTGREARADDQFAWDKGRRATVARLSDRKIRSEIDENTAGIGLTHAKTGKTHADTTGKDIQNFIPQLIQSTSQKLLEMKTQGASPKQLKAVEDQIRQLLEFQASMTQSAGGAYPRNLNLMQLLLGGAQDAGAP